MTGANGGRRAVVVLVSGGGTNLQALIDRQRASDCPWRIVAVVSNRPGAGALARAEAAGIPALVVDHKLHADRAGFERALDAAIAEPRPDLVACAGFMRILTPAFTARHAGRLVNIHPSLLPDYKGLDTHARALADGRDLAGCTVHWVSAGVDEGAIIGQAAVPVMSGDTPETLARRVLAAEHRLYPACIDLIAAGQARLSADGRANLRDGMPFILTLPPQSSGGP